MNGNVLVHRVYGPILMPMRTTLPSTSLHMCDQCPSCKATIAPYQQAAFQNEDGSISVEPSILCDACNELELQHCIVNQKASAFMYDAARRAYDERISYFYAETLQIQAAELSQRVRWCIA